MVDDLKIIIAFFRGTSGVTLKQALLAVLSLAKVGVDQLADAATSLPPSTPPGTSAIADPEGMIQHFERLVADHDAGRHAAIALPWETIIPLLVGLFQKWLGGKK